MAIPDDALREAKAFCDRRVPSELRDEMRLEVTARGNTITIVEWRAPWDPQASDAWTSTDVAQLRFDGIRGVWFLRHPDRSGRWRTYTERGATKTLAPQLAELDDDPTGIFWG